MHNAQNEKQAQLRLRMALHAGETAKGPTGWTSPALNKTQRLIEADFGARLDLAAG